MSAEVYSYSTAVALPVEAGNKSVSSILNIRRSLDKSVFTLGALLGAEATTTTHLLASIQTRPLERFSVAETKKWPDVVFPPSFWAT